jgi:hypothetical protein
MGKRRAVDGKLRSAGPVRVLVDLAGKLVLSGPALSLEQNDAMVGAAWSGHVELVGCLLDETGHLNVRSEWATSALCSAANRGDVKVMEHLLDKRANPVSRSGTLALHCLNCVTHFNLDALETLLKLSPDYWTEFQSAPYIDTKSPSIFPEFLPPPSCYPLNVEALPGRVLR